MKTIKILRFFDELFDVLIDVVERLCFNSFFFLSVGQHYAIRVRALNAAGAGPWSLESDQLNCKYSRLRPKVSFKDVATKEVVTFKAGESMAFEVDIQGEPPAHDIIWVRILCLKFSLNPLRLSLMRETDTNMTTAQS